MAKQKKKKKKTPPQKKDKKRSRQEKKEKIVFSQQADNTKVSGYTVVTGMNYVKYFKATYHLESQTTLFCSYFSSCLFSLLPAQFRFFDCFVFVLF